MGYNLGLFMNLKEKIISESMKLFSLKGYLSTSINDIMNASGTSKGGLYNHFKNKEELFFSVLEEARRIWREINLKGIKEISSPVGKIIKLLENYKDYYLKDTEHFPGGCIFVSLSVELDDQIPKLSREINKGFIRLKKMFIRLLEEGKLRGELREDVNTEELTEMIFACMLGASVIFGVEKSEDSIDRSINSIIAYIKGLAPLKNVNKQD